MKSALIDGNWSSKKSFSLFRKKKNKKKTLNGTNLNYFLRSRKTLVVCKKGRKEFGQEEHIEEREEEKSDATNL